MADYGTEFTSPLGRIVYGHPAKMQDKTDPQTKQPKIGADGQRIKQISFGLAIPKDQCGAMWAAMQAEAAKGYPQGIPGNFSWKLKDGDGVDREGKPYSQREGYAGCYILAISSELQAVPMYVFQNGAYMQLQPDQLKCGDYVTVGLNFKVNVPRDRTHTPGLYVNPLSVLLMFEGDEIKSGYQADPNALFGQQQPQYAMPAGARPVGAGGPVGQVPPPGAGMPGMTPQMPGAGMPMQPAPVAPPPPAVAAGPVRPVDPSHVHNNGDGTEQWLVNGAWDGQRHPITAAPTMPPPATDFIPGPAAVMPGSLPMPGQAPAPSGGMPGMPAPR